MTTPTVERRIRIGDWLIPYDDAETEVVVMRTLADILKATPGDHRNCMNSICIRAQRNEHAFPHPVYVVSTTETRVYIVDRLNDSGEPAHAIRYELTARDSALIKAHDRRAEGTPGELRLHVPTDPKGSPKRKAAGGGGRYGDLPKGKRMKGAGKNTGKKKRPVTANSLGAKRRFVAAVGAMRDDDLDA